MKDVLLNLANYLLIQYCLQNNIDCSGTYVQKIGRGYSYQLCKQHTNIPVVRVKFDKYNAPQYMWQALEG